MHRLSPFLSRSQQQQQKPPGSGRSAAAGSVEPLLLELVREEYAAAGGEGAPPPPAGRSSAGPSSARSRAERAAVLAAPEAAAGGEPLFYRDPDEEEDEDGIAGAFGGGDGEYYAAHDDDEGGGEYPQGGGGTGGSGGRLCRRLERHHRLVRLLRRGGLYAPLSPAARWGLFAVGQQACVYESLHQLAAAAAVPEGEGRGGGGDDLLVADWLSELDSPGRAVDWLGQIEEALYGAPRGQAARGGRAEPEEDDPAFVRLGTAAYSTRGAAAAREQEEEEEERQREVRTRLARPFVRLLCAAVRAAAEYRSRELASLYELPDDAAAAPPPLLLLPPPQGKEKTAAAASALVSPLWTSRDEVRGMLRRQLERWLDQPPAVPAAAAGGDGLWRKEAMETIASAALESFRDACELGGGGGAGAGADQQHPRQRLLLLEYASVQALAIKVVRDLLQDDPLAWELSVEHSCFASLCEMSRSHGRLARPGGGRGPPYGLGPLFRHFNGRSCAASPAVPFCHYVLQWHADRKLWGHVLEYGAKHCPGALAALLESPASSPDLRKLSWVHAVIQGDHDRAADCLVANARDPLSTLRCAQNDLAVAKLANRAAAAASRDGGGGGLPPSPALAAAAERRGAEIDTLRMLAQSQEELAALAAIQGLEDDDRDAGASPPMTARELLRLVLDRAASAASPPGGGAAPPPPGELASLLLLGLRACSALEQGEGGASASAAADVWLEAIRLSGGWLQDAFPSDEEPSVLPPSPLSPELVRSLRSRTVFGLLLEHVLEETSYGDDAGTTSSRLLRRVSFRAVEDRARRALDDPNLSGGLAGLASALEGEQQQRRLAASAVAPMVA